MLGTVRIQGGDTTANNTVIDAPNFWAEQKQFTTRATFLTKLVVFVPTAIGTTQVVWLFDTAAGSAASVDPKVVLTCPPGFTTTLDFGDYGKLFPQGLFIAVADNEPIDPTTAPADSGANRALVTIDYKLK